MSHRLVNNSTGGEVTGPVHVSRDDPEEPHVVSLGAHHKSKCRSILVTSNLGGTLPELSELLSD